MATKKEPSIDELYKALDKLGFKYEHSESHEGLEVVNFLVTPTDEDEENEDEQA
jgi:signal recognition particle subunit SEC65